MNLWLKPVLSCVLISTVASVLLGEEKQRKFIYGMISVLIVAILLKPVVAIKNKNFGEMFSGENQIITSGEMTELFGQAQKNLTELEIRTLLKKCGYFVSVSVYGSFTEKGEVDLVEIYLQNNGITVEEENILEITETVSTACGIDKQKIRVIHVQEDRSKIE